MRGWWEFAFQFRVRGEFEPWVTSRGPLLVCARHQGAPPSLTLFTVRCTCGGGAYRAVVERCTPCAVGAAADVERSVAICAPSAFRHVSVSICPPAAVAARSQWHLWLTTSCVCVLWHAVCVLPCPRLRGGVQCFGPRRCR